MHNKKVGREVKLGVLFTVALFLAVWGINYLKGTDIFTRQLRFHAVYDDIGGLLESNAVTVSGVKIGQVDRIAFHPDGSGRVIVTAVIGQQIAIPDNSKAYLGGGLIGERKILIALGDSHQNIASDDTLIGRTEPSLTNEIAGQITPFIKKTEVLVIRADSVLQAIHEILSPENKQHITSSIDNLHKTMASLERASATVDESIHRESQRLSDIMANVHAITTNLENNNKLFNSIMQNMADISDTVASDEVRQTLGHIGQSMETLTAILQKIESGRGSAGLLLEDDALYHNLVESSDKLEMLLEDIRENPGRYFRISVFGR